MNNKQLAQAIAALFALQTDGDWTDTNEALNDAAFLLWEKADCARWEMRAMLVQAGVDVDTAIDFCEIPN